MQGGDFIHPELVGLIPAAGAATRLGSPAGSKEVLAVGWEAAEGGRVRRPKPVCLYALEAMRLAGARRAYVVIRDGKWDIPAHLGDGERLGMGLGYLLMGRPFGAPYTLDQAYRFVRGADVLLGFPDIIFEPPEAYGRIVERRRAGGADVVLGLFPAADPAAADLVDLEGGGSVRRIHVKPGGGAHGDTWGVAVWGDTFTEFLHEHLKTSHPDVAAPGGSDREAYVGNVIQAGIDAGLRVEACRVSDRAYIDTGTPEGLLEALRIYTLGEPTGKTTGNATGERSISGPSSTDNSRGSRPAGPGSA